MVGRPRLWGGQGGGEAKVVGRPRWGGQVGDAKVGEAKVGRPRWGGQGGGEAKVGRPRWGSLVTH